MSKRGVDLGKRLKEIFYPEAIIFSPLKYVEEGIVAYPLEKPSQSLGYLFDELQNDELYASHRMIFIMAMGIALRGINGHIKDKRTDPACILLDEQGEFAISLLSGHLGGANEDTLRISKVLGATPVVTTATDRAGLGAFDEIAKEVKGYHPQFKELILRINQGLLEGKSIGLYSEYPLRKTNGFIPLTTLEEAKNIKLDELIVVSHKDLDLTNYPNAIHLIPKKIVIGTGAKKDLPLEVYQVGLEQFLEKEGIRKEAITGFVSIDVKAKEECILKTAKEMGAYFKTYPKEILVKWEDLYPGSDFVKAQVGVASVAATSVHEATGKACCERFEWKGATFVYGIEKEDKC